MNLTLQVKPRKNALEVFPEALVKVPQYNPIKAQETQDEAITTFNDGIDEPDDLDQEQLLYYSVKLEPGQETKQ